MRILQVTNLIGPHQLPVARQLAAAVGERHFRLAATLPMTAAMGERGWGDDQGNSWILRAGEDHVDRRQLDEWWTNADVVICGVRDLPQCSRRVHAGKVTFFASERWWKPPLGMCRLLSPKFAWTAARFRNLGQLLSFHYLAMGSHAAGDMRRIAPFKDRVWDWGYFTALPEPIAVGHTGSGHFRVLWAGRMLPWKRVDILVRAFTLLLRQAPAARLSLIGDGPTGDSARRMVRDLGIADSVEFSPTMDAASVRVRMRQADVYVLPSNGAEGWGAVLNEAMSEGCAVVASEEAGAAKMLIHHGVNGLLFRSGDHRALASMLIQLCVNEPLRQALGEAGQRTISETWSPRVAAERLLAVSNALLSSGPAPRYASGPMARTGF